MTHNNPSPQQDPTIQNPAHMSVDQLRQGETGTGLRYVLVISTLAALIALAVVFWTMS